jgi:hypothetical protein
MVNLPDACLVVLDIDRTHEYVFYPPRLRLIRGASYLLDSFIRNLEKEFLNKPERPYGDYQVIYSNGGAAQFLFQDKSKALSFVQTVEWEFSRWTCSAGITGHVEPWVHPEKFRVCQERALTRLNRKKRSGRSPQSPLTSVYAKPCEECGVFPAARKAAKKDAYFCPSCLRKEENRENRNKLHSDFEECIPANLFPPNPSNFWPNNFTEIAARSKPNGYLGLIYADVNRMGERQRRLLRDDTLGDSESVKIISRFSNEVEQALFKSACEVVRENIDPTEYPYPYPVEFSLAGGDDLIIVLPADKALPIAMELCRHVEEKNISGGEKLTLSVGIVLAKGNFPFVGMLEMSKQLLKSAKKKNWDMYVAQQDGSVVDFQLLDSSLRGLEQIRAGDLPIRVTDIGNRPYAVAEIEKLVQHVRELKQLGLPSGRLKQLHKSLMRGKQQALLDYCLMLTRVTEEQGRYLRKEFPPQHGGLLFLLPEMIEIYDFIPRSKERVHA